MVYTNPFDWVNPVASAVLFITGIFIFPFLFWLQQFWWTKTKSGKSFIKTYQLTEKDTMDISNKIVSSFQAICAGVSGVIICAHCADNVLHCIHTMAIGYAWFGIPYFIYDTMCMFYVFTFARKIAVANSLQETSVIYTSSMLAQFIQFVMHSPVIFIHHMIMAHVGWTLILFYRDPLEPGDFFVGIIYMMEFSTPFVSIRSILSKLKMKSSIWYGINGLLMLVTFPVFRILSVLYALMLYTEQNNYPNIFQGFMGVPIHWRSIWVIAESPQIYWYFLMCKGLVKIFTKKNVENKIISSSPSSSSGIYGANAGDNNAKTEVDKQELLFEELGRYGTVKKANKVTDESQHKLRNHCNSDDDDGGEKTSADNNMASTKSATTNYVLGPNQMNSRQTNTKDDKILNSQ